MKYMGSKARFADRIYARINEITPRNGRTWVEPFAGGMNMTMGGGSKNSSEKLFKQKGRSP